MSVESDLRRFGARRYFELEDAIKDIRVRDIGPKVMLAVGLRESNLINTLNPGGTDRGIFQITDIYHKSSLSKVPGCPAAKFSDPTTWGPSWVPESGKTAADPGYVPTLKDGAIIGYNILKRGHSEAFRLGLKGGAAIRFALAAYNAGVGGAKKGLDEGDVDKYTTGGDYSYDVLMVRWKAVNTIMSKFGWF